jgi:hypothetical protein
MTFVTTMKRVTLDHTVATLYQLNNMVLYKAFTRAKEDSRIYLFASKIACTFLLTSKAFFNSPLWFKWQLS